MGMRFNGIAIPPGASIVNAYIQFQVDGEHLIQSPDDSVGGLDSCAMADGGSGGSRSTDTRHSRGHSRRGKPTRLGERELVGCHYNRTGERVAESYNRSSSAAALLHVEYVQ